MQYRSLRAFILCAGLLLSKPAGFARAQETHEWAEAEMARAQLMVDVVFGLSNPEDGREQALLGEPLEAAGGELAPYVTAPAPALGATQSLLLAGSYAVARSLHLGARSAVSMTGALPTADGSLSAMATLSNTELEVERPVRLSEDTEASLGLALVLPTAQGHEPEDDLFAEAQPLREIAADPTGMHAEVSEAAAAARGFEDGALFRAERVGLIPKARLSHQKDRLRVDIYVKLENLLSTRVAPHHRYLGELVVGAFYGYDLLAHITLGVRLWSNLLLEKTADTNFVCEPQLRIQGGPLQGLVGAVMPIVNRPNMLTGLSGLRIAAAALF